MAELCVIDDKHIPLRRIIWVSELPHFCGQEDCAREGEYEVCLESRKTVWATREERDKVLEQLRSWKGDH